MEQVKSKDNTCIAYDRTGQGQPLILVGGAFNTRTFGPNEAMVSLLRPHFTVINYDRRGRGQMHVVQAGAIVPALIEFYKSE